MDSIRLLWLAGLVGVAGAGLQGCSRNEATRAAPPVDVVAASAQDAAAVARPIPEAVPHPAGVAPTPAPPPPPPKAIATGELAAARHPAELKRLPWPGGGAPAGPTPAAVADVQHKAAVEEKAKAPPSAPASLESTVDARLSAEPEVEGEAAPVYLDIIPRGSTPEAIAASAVATAIPGVEVTPLTSVELQVDPVDFATDSQQLTQNVAVRAGEAPRLVWFLTPVRHAHKRGEVKDSRRVWVVIRPMARVAGQEAPESSFTREAFIDVRVGPQPPLLRQAWDAVVANWDTLAKIGGAVVTALLSVGAWIRRRRTKQAAREADAPLPVLEDDSLRRAA